MELSEFKAKALTLLREDEEFRYAVLGLLGLDDLRRSIEKLIESIEELVEAQERFEERISRLEDVYVKLTERVGRLEEAHIKLTEQVGILAESIGRLGERVDRLDDAYVKLTESISSLGREVGRLSDTIGFGLEDVARVVIPGWLYRHEGIMVDDLVRKFFYIDGVEVEVNLYGEGVRSGRRVVILGEAKSRIYRGDVEGFYGSVGKVLGVVRDPVYLLMFAFYIHPSAEEAASPRGIKLIASYMR